MVQEVDLKSKFYQGWVYSRLVSSFAGSYSAQSYLPISHEPIQGVRNVTPICVGVLECYNVSLWASHSLTGSCEGGATRGHVQISPGKVLVVATLWE